MVYKLNILQKPKSYEGTENINLENDTYIR